MGRGGEGRNTPTGYEDTKGSPLRNWECDVRGTDAKASQMKSKPRARHRRPPDNLLQIECSIRAVPKSLLWAE